MPSDLIPRIPVSPARQPQGGLLQGLEEGLDRAQKENALRRELSMRDEMDMRGEERRQKFSQGQQERGFQQQMLMDKQRTTGQMMMEQQKHDQEQQVIKGFQEFLSTEVEGSEALTPQTQEFDRMLGGMREGMPKFLQNIVPKQAPRSTADRGPRTVGQILSSDMSAEEIAIRHPKTYAMLASSGVGQQLLKNKAATASAGAEKIPWDDIRQNPGAFVGDTLDQMKKMGYSDAAITMIRHYAEAANKQAIAAVDMKAYQAAVKQTLVAATAADNEAKSLETSYQQAVREFASLPLEPARPKKMSKQDFEVARTALRDRRAYLEAEVKRLPGLAAAQRTEADRLRALAAEGKAFGGVQTGKDSVEAIKADRSSGKITPEEAAQRYNALQGGR